MSNVRAALGTARNHSKSLVSFNKLPDEIIANILSLIGVDDPLDPRYDDLYPIEYKQPLHPLLGIIASSKHLRHIAINTPSLWTYVELSVETLRDTYLEHVRRVLLYSQQLPLQVRIIGEIDDEEEKEEDVSNCLILLLGSHTHRIASLDFQIPLTCAWPVKLDLFTDISSCQIRELYTNDPDAYPEQIDDTFPDRLLDGDLDVFLQSLRVIGTRGFFIPLATTPAYRDLTVLKVMPYEFKWSQPTLVQLRNALAACPKLCSLALIECNFGTESRAPIEPVLLPDLEILDLRSLENGNELVALMSCIDSGSSELAFSVSTDETISANATAKLRQFITKSNVTRLCLDATVDVTDLDWLLALPKGKNLAIRELALCAYNFEGVEFDQPLRSGRFPSLHTLHLMECEGVDVRVCRQLLDASAIQVLRFDNPRTIVQEMFRVAPSVEHCRFSTSIAYREDNREWPVYVFH
ncbi:hypothetical protein FRC12_011363 [Ceratobasidium sp. 428]|nr:hypothetical protein FRC12_011363 [Ceratobasidium sp. 428]